MKICMNPAMLIDLYELTMAACYFENRMTGPATFSLFIRSYPPDRGYFVSAGLEDVVDYLASLRFEAEDIDYLARSRLFKDDFLHFLGDLRFTGEVHAIPEGRIFFRDEPILEITAPMIEAQIVETFVINAVNLQVSIATKASRCVQAAGGRRLIDFSLRRTHGTDAGLKVARAGYIGGLDGTSNVMAGQRYAIPISGTMAHSFVVSFPEEIDAFRAFSRTFPQSTVLLIDTYDTVSGARKAAAVAKEMAERGDALTGVRLDSGDMAELSRDVREVLRGAGLETVRIFASGGFDEFKIAEVIGRGAEIDAFGVGTKMGVSADAPYTNIAYKLVEYEGRPLLKLSSGKESLASRKQVFRRRMENRLSDDMIALREEKGEGEPLLLPEMKEGRRIKPPEPLEAIRERFLAELRELGGEYKRLEKPDMYPVSLSPGLDELQKETIRRVTVSNIIES